MTQELEPAEYKFRSFRKSERRRYHRMHNHKGYVKRYWNSVDREKQEAPFRAELAIGPCS